MQNHARWQQPGILNMIQNKSVSGQWSDSQTTYMPCLWFMLSLAEPESMAITEPRSWTPRGEKGLKKEGEANWHWGISASQSCSSVLRFISAWTSKLGLDGWPGTGTKHLPYVWRRDMKLLYDDNSWFILMWETIPKYIFRIRRRSYMVLTTAHIKWVIFLPMSIYYVTNSNMAVYGVVYQLTEMIYSHVIQPPFRPSTMELHCQHHHSTVITLFTSASRQSKKYL